MKDLKIIFLDFTGTIDFYEVPKNKPETIESKIISTPYKTKELKPSRRMQDAGERFYENADAAFGGFGYVGEKNIPFYDFSGIGEEINQEVTTYVSQPIVVDYGPNKKSIKFLSKLLDKTGAKIVYSCSRRWDGWKKCADFVGLPHRHSLGLHFPEHGITPELEWQPFDFKSLKDFDTHGDVSRVGYKEREKEIKEWFKKWNGAKVQNYVILDDDPMTTPEMKAHWIPSVYDNGFLEEEYKEALRILTS